MTNMSILESVYSPGGHITDDENAPGYMPYNGGLLPKTLKTSRRMYTFRENFIIESPSTNVLLSIYLGPASYPYDVYINGKKVLSRGGRDSNYQPTSFATIPVQLPSNLLVFGRSYNKLVIQAYPVIENAPLEAPMIMPDFKASRMAFFRNLFNVHLIQASFAIGLLLGMYFLFHYSARNYASLHYLYFALLCFFFSFCYVNFTFNYSFTNEFLLEKASRLSFPMAVLFLTLFVRELTAIWKNFLFSIILAIPPVFASVFIFFQDTVFKVDDFFNNIALVYIIGPYLLTGFAIIIISYFRTFKLIYLIIIMSYIVLFAGSVHDTMFLMLHENPFCWLVPYGYFTMVICIFMILAIEESNIYEGSIKRASEINDKNESMNKIIQKIELVSRNLARSSMNLGGNIDKATAIIRNSSKNNKAIADRLLIELQGIENVIYQITSRMEISVVKIPQAIAGQTSVVEQTNRTVASMNAHIDSILQATMQTNIIAQELSKIASSGRDIVLKSKESIKDVSLNSQFIGEILFNIREIVEESNFLSINASIESAHAGEAGKGFSILANEIRELSNKSRERLEMSQDRLKQMISFVNESISLSEQATNSLLLIMDKSQNSAGMISTISEEMNSHKTESGEILKGSDALLTETVSIKSMSEEDRKENESLKQVLSDLRKSFTETSNLMRTQLESERNISEAIDRIQEVLAANLKAMDLLKEGVMIANQDMA
jgi:methyl-accepting chemotaxis protein